MNRGRQQPPPFTPGFNPNLPHPMARQQPMGPMMQNFRNQGMATPRASQFGNLGY